MIRDVYQIELENSGFLVETAVDGEEALAKVVSYLPDLILLDIFLPKLSGFEVVEQLKKDSTYSGIPIIVLTNIYVDKTDMIKKGVEHCLIKAEITPGSLVEKINETLGA